MNRSPQMMTLRILGRLLAYPTPELIAALPDCRRRLADENILAPAALRDLDTLMAAMAARDLLDLQEEYVALFDRTPSLSLHLFEHVHGDGRDRGQALVDLMGVYRDAGLEIACAEIPDYLPLFLEFLSSRERREAARHLGDVVDILGVLEARLVRRQSPWSRVMMALVGLAARKPSRAAVRLALKQAGGAPPTGDELDRSWAETPAFDTPPDAGPAGDADCGRAADMLRRMG